jgi:hypothetical protein
MKLTFMKLSTPPITLTFGIVNPTVTLCFSGARGASSTLVSAAHYAPRERQIGVYTPLRSAAPPSTVERLFFRAVRASLFVSSTAFARSATEALAKHGRPQESYALHTKLHDCLYETECFPAVREVHMGECRTGAATLYECPRSQKRC